jgi:hypothetical protein
MARKVVRQPRDRFVADGAYDKSNDQLARYSLVRGRTEQPVTMPLNRAPTRQGL